MLYLTCYTNASCTAKLLLLLPVFYGRAQRMIIACLASAMLKCVCGARSYVAAARLTWMRAELLKHSHTLPQHIVRKQKQQKA